ncbi:MAG: DUF3109 family protein [Bacteroidaceae bacterium]|jgi:hypothetical protein
MKRNELDIIQVDNVLLSIDCFREEFACDLGICKGQCCIEGDAGAPVTLDEIMSIEDIVPQIEKDLSADAMEVIRNQGVAYIDPEGELVTSIVHGKDCVFTCYDENGVCLCAIERAQREGRIHTAKPLSCWLYPIRIKKFKNGSYGVNYHRWNICTCGITKGKKLKLPVYRFLKEPLIAQFGQEWYEKLEQTALALKKQNML